MIVLAIIYKPIRQLKTKPCRELLQGFSRLSPADTLYMIINILNNLIYNNKLFE